MYRKLWHIQLLWLLVVAVGAGCASHSRDLIKVREALLQDDVSRAIAEFEKKSEKKSDLLYLLERGYMYHLGGRWEESNMAFEAAERRFDELYTRSISRQAAALLTNDLALPYRSSPFEMQLVQYYRALNYMALGQPDEALVEARKANHILKSYEPDNSGALRQDAFVQYVTGLLYESQAEVNDAVVSFREAARLYRSQTAHAGQAIPVWLDEDYYAAAEHLNLRNDVDSLLASDSTIAERATASGRNNLVLFFEAGFVPFKESVDITFPVFDVVDNDHDDKKLNKKKREERRKRRNKKLAAWYVRDYGDNVYAYRKDRVKLDHFLRFAFPELIDAPGRIFSCELELADGRILGAMSAMNLAGIARDDFEDRLPGILLKTLGRALVKEGVRKAVKKEDKALGALVNLFGVATEQADTRSWIFLPAEIFMLKARLEPGPQVLIMRFRDGQGQILDEKRLELDVSQNQVEFVSVRSFR